MSDIKEGRVKVYVRVKPSSWNDLQVYNISNNQLQIKDPNGNVERDKWFKFDKIFSPQATNKEVFKSMKGEQLVGNVLKGYNGALFAYGQTGGGKTHTLMSKDGVTAHLVCNLFAMINNDQQHEYEVTCSYVQVYNEHVFDLLNSNQKLHHALREHPDGGFYVENASLYKCHNPSDVYQLLNSGRKRLAFAETRMNRQSSRSHAICQLFIQKTKRTGSRTEVHTPLESSSPRHANSMVELKGLEGIGSGPVRSSLTKRHSIAVSQPTKRGPQVVLRNPSKRHRSVRVVSMGGRSLECLNEDEANHHTSTARLDMSMSSVQLDRSSSMEALNDSEMSTGRLTIRRGSRPKSLDPSAFEELLSHQDSSLNQSVDSVLDEMEWQLHASTADISQVLMEKEEASETNEEITVVEEEEAEEGMIVKSKLTIVDLAGSERVKRSQAEGERLTEAQNINLSLLELGNVIAALTDSKRTHIPFRNSVLTRLLQDNLGGNCMTSFILCVSGSPQDMSETRCTLEFGKKLLKVKMQPKLNVEVDYKKMCEELQASNKTKEEEFIKERGKMLGQIENLKREKERQDKERQKLDKENLMQKSAQKNLQKDLMAANQKAKDMEAINKIQKEEKHNENAKITENEINEPCMQKNKLQKTDGTQTSFDSASTECQSLCNALDNSLSRDRQTIGQSANESKSLETRDTQTGEMFMYKEYRNSATCISPREVETKDCASSPIKSLIDKLVDSPSPDRANKQAEKKCLHNILVTELRAVQLFYSTLDLICDQNEPRIEQLTKLNRSPVSVTPSGYETSSQGHDRYLNVDTKSVTSTSGRKLPSPSQCSPALLPSSLCSSPPSSYQPSYEHSILSRLQDTASQAGSPLEEIIETSQRHSNMTTPTKASRVKDMYTDFVRQKASIDQEIVNLVSEMLQLPKGENLRKQDLYAELVKQIHEQQTDFSTEKLEHILNLGILDQTISSCLLTLSSKDSQTMPRLSSIKSSNSKSLLGYVDVEHELYGYENSAAVFVDADDEDESDDAIDDLLDYSVTSTPDMNASRMVGETNNDSAEEDSSPIVKKKGLRRFLCMPKKSKKASRAKRTPPKATKRNHVSLLECEEE